MRGWCKHPPRPPPPKRPHVRAAARRPRRSASVGKGARWLPRAHGGGGAWSRPPRTLVKRGRRSSRRPIRRRAAAGWEGRPPRASLPPPHDHARGSRHHIIATRAPQLADVLPWRTRPAAGGAPAGERERGRRPGPLVSRASQKNLELWRRQVYLEFGAVGEEGGGGGSSRGEREWRPCLCGGRGVVWLADGISLRIWPAQTAKRRPLLRAVPPTSLPFLGLDYWQQTVSSSAGTLPGDCGVFDHEANDMRAVHTVEIILY